MASKVGKRKYIPLILSPYQDNSSKILDRYSIHIYSIVILYLILLHILTQNITKTNNSNGIKMNIDSIMDTDIFAWVILPLLIFLSIVLELPWGVT